MPPVALRLGYSAPPGHRAHPCTTICIQQNTSPQCQAAPPPPTHTCWLSCSLASLYSLTILRLRFLLLSKPSLNSMTSATRL